MASDAVPPLTILRMVQSLLADRFNLRTHLERRTIPVYQLTVARPGRLGPDLRPSSIDCGRFVAGGGTANSEDKPVDAQGRDVCFNVYDFKAMQERRNMTVIRSAGGMPWLIRHLLSLVDRPIVDKTGLTGSFEWELTSSNDSKVESSAPTVFAALSGRLGLNLQPATGPAEVLVIDSIQSPTPD